MATAKGSSGTIHQSSETDYLHHLLKGIDAFEKSGHSTDPGDWRDGLLSIRRSLRQRLGEIDSPAQQSEPTRSVLQPQV